MITTITHWTQQKTGPDHGYLVFIQQTSPSFYKGRLLAMPLEGSAGSHPKVARVGMDQRGQYHCFSRSIEWEMEWKADIGL